MPIPTPETHDRPPIAGRVVYRHLCRCEHASRPLDPGEEVEHRFDVDGEPFPWYITEDGARFTRRGELYLVEVDILPVKPVGHRDDEFAITVRTRRAPLLNGEPFPWATLAGSIRVDAPDDSFPVLHLTFLANNVDTDGNVTIDAEIVDDEAPEEGGYQRYLERLAAGSSSGDCWGDADA